MKKQIFLTGDIRTSESVRLRKQIAETSKADVVVTVENSGSIRQV